MCIQKVQYRQGYSRFLIKFSIFGLTRFWNKLRLESASFSVGNNIRNLSFENIYKCQNWYFASVVGNPCLRNTFRRAGENISLIVTNVLLIEANGL
jgi:hypothetical protein